MLTQKGIREKYTALADKYLAHLKEYDNGYWEKGW